MARIIWTCLFAASCLLFTRAVEAAVVTVDVTIKAVNPQARGITVVYKTELGEKIIELDVTRKAEITVNGKDGTLEGLGAGLKAKVSYDKDLGVVTKIEATGTLKVAKKPELIEVSELNDEGGNDHPWVSEDGLTIYWDRFSPGQRKGSIWTAHRQSPESPFENKKSLFAGKCPTVSSDGLEMILVGERTDGGEGMSLQVATREAIDKPFGRPKEIGTLQDFNAWAPSLSADSRTLYFGAKTPGGKGSTVYTTRADKESPWSKPRPFDAPGFEEADIGLSFITPDGLTIFSQGKLPGQGVKSPPSPVMLSRASTRRPFREPQGIRINNRLLYGFWPRYVQATQELFLVRVPVKDGQWDKGKPVGLWVIKNFSPTDVAK